MTEPIATTDSVAPARSTAAAGPIAIGPYRLPGRSVLAPMVGVTDLPFRRLCLQMGASLAAGEMVAAEAHMRDTALGQRRIAHDGESEPRIVQIAGGDAAVMADAARYNVEQGAQIIDINMGCPNKKVCRKAAGSALLSDEARVAEILEATVAAVSVPVTLKIRTGPEPANRNAVTITRIAQESGIAALAVHGRTRADRFRGHAEYDTIADVCAAATIPVFANGDILSPRDAQTVLQHTGADGVMVGRGAQGRPWIFREIEHFLATGAELAPPSAAEVCEILDGHLKALHAFYGEALGLRIARKHIGWYLDGLPDCGALRRRVLTTESASDQRRQLASWFEQGRIAA